MYILLGMCHIYNVMRILSQQELQRIAKWHDDQHYRSKAKRESFEQVRRIKRACLKNKRALIGTLNTNKGGRDHEYPIARRYFENRCYSKSKKEYNERLWNMKAVYEQNTKG